jgi:hypothetical protein
MIVLWIWCAGVLAIFRSLAWVLLTVGTVGLLRWSWHKRPLPTTWRKQMITLHLAVTVLPPIWYWLCFFAPPFGQWLQDIIAVKIQPFVGWSLLTWIGLHLRLRSETSTAYRVGLTFLLLLAWHIVVNVMGAHFVTPTG